MTFLLLQKTFITIYYLPTPSQLVRQIKAEESSMPSEIGRFLSLQRPRHVNEINNTTKKESDRENNVENISAYQIAWGYWIKKISPQNPFKANGYLVNTKSHVIHSLHNSWSSSMCMGGIWMCLVLNASVCAFRCLCPYVCVGKRVWTSQRYCWRFSARPWEKRAEGCKVIFEGAGKKQSVSVSSLHKPRLWDLWDAFVWLCGGHETRQTGALVRPLCVGALPILTQGHLVADVLTLVYVYTGHLV